VFLSRDFEIEVVDHGLMGIFYRPVGVLSFFSMSMVLQLHMIQDADSAGKEKQEVFAIFDDTHFGDGPEAEAKRKVRNSRSVLALFRFFSFISCSS
jgi:hypothetical protein